MTLNQQAIFKEIERLKAENARMKAALAFIAALEPGSRGAYSKFAEARSRAMEALEDLKPKASDGTLRIKKGER
jgi:hypothetical protein